MHSGEDEVANEQRSLEKGVYMLTMAESMALSNADCIAEAEGYFQLFEWNVPNSIHL